MKMNVPQVLKSSSLSSKFSLHFGLEPRALNNQPNNSPQQLFSFQLPNNGPGFLILLTTPPKRSPKSTDVIELSITDVPAPTSDSTVAKPLTLQASASTCRSKTHTTIISFEFEVYSPPKPPTSTNTNSTSSVSSDGDGIAVSSAPSATSPSSAYHSVTIFKDGSPIATAFKIPVSSVTGQVISQGASQTAESGGSVFIGCHSTALTGVECLDDRISSVAILKEHTSQSIRQFATSTLDARGVVAVCGDGTVLGDSAEECDDGNATPGDGCSCDCLKECPHEIPYLSARHLSIIQGDGFAPGDARILACSSGAAPVASSQSINTQEEINCLDGGKWSVPSLTCAPTCGPISPFSPVSHMRLSRTPAAVSENTPDKFAEGATATIKCEDGFTDRANRPEETLTCANGEWYRATLVCEPTCPPSPSLPPSIVVSLSSDTPKTSSGGVIQVECNSAQAYIPVASPTATLTCSNGEWQGSLPSCFKSCPVVKMPLGVQVFGNALLEAQRKSLTSLKSMHEETLVENDKAVRDSSTPVPLGNDTPSPANLAKSANVTDSTSIPANSTTIITSANVTASANTQPSSSDLVVQVTPASSTTSSPKTSFIHLKASPNVPHGSSVSVSCSPGFSSASLSTATSEMRCHDGEWQGGEDLKCLQQCPSFAPPSIDGYVITAAAPADEQLISNSTSTSMIENTNSTASAPAANSINDHGSSRTISCAEGFQPVSSSSSSQSEEVVRCVNGKWQKPTLRCMKSCSTPPHYASLAPYQWTPPSSSAAHGATGTLSCSPGYFPNGPFATQSVACLDGRWAEKALECKLSCPADLPDLSLVRSSAHLKVIPDSRRPNSFYSAPAANSTETAVLSYHGASYEVTCQDGFNAISKDEREKLFCINGVWQIPSKISCKAPCNSQPPESSSKQFAVLGDGLIHGSTRKVTCKPGFAVAQGVSSQENILTCLDGKWTKSTLRCESGCGPFPSLDEDSYTIQTAPSNTTTAAVAAGTALGDVRIVSCVSNPSLTQTVTCRISESGASWEPLALTCGVSCAAPILSSSTTLTADVSSAIKSSSNSTSGAVIDSYLSGSQLHVRCADSYTATSGVSPAPILCTSAGKWTAPNLTCQKSCTSSPLLPRGVEIINSYGGEVGGGARRRVACSKGYSDVTRVHEDDVFCSADKGQWTAPALRCEPVCANPMESDLGNLFVFNKNDFDSFAINTTLASNNNNISEGSEQHKITFSTGSSLRLSCNGDNGFAPQSGSKEEGSIVCQIGGLWSLPGVTCGRRCEPPSALLDPIRYNSTYLTANPTSDDLIPTLSAAETGYQEGTIRVVSCAAGYSNAFFGIGDRAISVCSNGSWTQIDSLLCEPMCMNTPDSTNPVQGGKYMPAQKMTNKNADYSTFRHLSTFEIACNSTANFFPDHVQTSENLQCIRGKWTEPTLKCMKSCGKFDLEEVAISEAAGYVIRSSSYNMSDVNVVPIGADWVEIGCEPTHYSSGQDFDSERIRCSAVSSTYDVDWEPLTLTCRKNCEPYPATPASTVAKTTPPTPTSPANAHGSVVSLSCAPSFAPSANSLHEETVRCFDGAWDVSSIECFASAAPAVASSSSSSLVQTTSQVKRRVDSLSNSSTGEDLTSMLTERHLVMVGVAKGEVSSAHGSTVEVQCAPGWSSRWQSDRASEILVSDQGKWSTPTLVCVKNCEPLEFDASLYQVLGSGKLSFGSQAIVKCSESAWPALNFEALAARRREHEVLVMQISNDNASNANRKAVAIPDFDERGISETLTCGDNGEWTPATLRCEPECSPFSIAANYSATIIPDSSKPQNHPRDAFTLACNEKNLFAPSTLSLTPQTSASTVCIDGKWSEAPALDCRKQCLPSSLPLHIRNNTELYSLFLLSSPSSSNDINLTPLASTSKSPASPFILNTNTLATPLPHGSMFMFSCNPQTASPSIGDENDLIVCRDGEWTGVSTVCSPLCPDLKLPVWKNPSSSSPSSAVAVTADGSTSSIASSVEKDGISSDFMDDESEKPKSGTQSQKLVLAQLHSSQQSSSLTNTALEGLVTMRVSSKTSAPRVASKPAATHPFINRSHGATRIVSCDEDAGFFPRIVPTQNANPTLQEAASGNPKSVTEELVCEHGQWTQPKILCEPGCSQFTLPIDVPKSAQDRYNFHYEELKPELVRILPSKSKQFAPGSTVRVSCEPDWLPSLSGASSSDFITCANGMWSGLALRCVAPSSGHAPQHSKPVSLRLKQSNTRSQSAVGQLQRS
eukprot:GDKJ01056872.1.p1 GENE.GDKJ01056872.1~~GDKJ01056872.1.p1  ORF type:complete len:2350 (+),score=660.86 GDKJ01056872.1:313-7050(+)